MAESEEKAKQRRFEESEAITKKAAKAFQDVFHSHNSTRLDLNERSDKDLVAILIDCTAYKTRDLVNASFRLLVQHFSQKQTLIQAFDRVILLPANSDQKQYDLVHELTLKLSIVVQDPEKTIPQ